MNVPKEILLISLGGGTNLYTNVGNTTVVRDLGDILPDGTSVRYLNPTELLRVIHDKVIDYYLSDPTGNIEGFIKYYETSKNIQGVPEDSPEIRETSSGK